MRLKFFVVALLVMMAPRFGHAGGPFFVDDVKFTGVAKQWPNNTVEWYMDEGRLSDTIDNRQAKDMVQGLLNEWSAVTIDNASNHAVSTTVVKNVFKGSIAVDITLSNLPQYMADSESRTIVILDETGEITDNLIGSGAKNSIPGFTTVKNPTGPDGTSMGKGIVVLNGYLLNKKSISCSLERPGMDVCTPAHQTDCCQPNSARDLEYYKAVMLHELGHLLNFDHIQSNYDIARLCKVDEVTGTCNDGNYIPTMYPHLLAPSQNVLGRDDKISVSWIYPTETFKKDFCTITGEVFDAKGNPLSGVNVIALRVGEGDVASKVDARSFVSGSMQPACKGGDGHYYLQGITPGRTYQVVYEPLGEELRGVSGFNPLPGGDMSVPPPQGFSKGEIQSSSGSTTVSCDEGGKTIEMASVTIDTANPCVYASSDSKAASSSPSSKCSLLPLGTFSYMLIVCLLMSAAVIVLVRVNTNKKCKK